MMIVEDLRSRRLRWESEGHEAEQKHRLEVREDFFDGVWGDNT